MHKLLVQYIIDTNGPLGVIIDGSTTKSNLHLLAVLITINEPIGKKHFLKVLNKPINTKNSSFPFHANFLSYLPSISMF